MLRKIEKIVLFFLVFILCLNQSGFAEDLRAKAVIEHASVFLGEPFVFQIQISGSESPEKPDLSKISDFTIEHQGGRKNSSTAVTIINGRMTQKVNQGYVFSYRLTPKQSGRLTIPSITIFADGRTARTSTVSVHVQQPEETDDFKLRIGLSKTHCYVGEPVTLTVTWYLGSDVRRFNINLPLLEKTDVFYFIDPDVDTGSGGKFYRIPLSGGDVIGEKGEGRLNNKNYATIRFEKILIPKKAGIINIEPASVICEALAGYRKQRRPFGDDFFSDFFNDDFFGLNRQGVYRKVAVPSNPLSLEVSQVPNIGKPDNFAGHVGEYRITAEATPQEMSIGDPITLKITLSGPDYLEHVSLPPLNRQLALKKHFKIPQERAVGEISGKTKTYTQTIRPLTPEIETIPAIEFPYFDTRTGVYKTAKTDPIRIKVKSTRIVTAMDAEGTLEPVISGSGIETWTKGIAHNYEDLSVIRNQRFGPMSWLKLPIILCMIVISPIIYLLLFTGKIVIKRLYADPFAVRARKAFGKLRIRLKAAETSASNQEYCETILDALRNFLGSKLRLPGGALTFNDVKAALVDNGVDIETLNSLENVFTQCEHGHYAGDADVFEPSILSEQILNIAKQLEKTLK